MIKDRNISKTYTGIFEEIAVYDITPLDKDSKYVSVFVNQENIGLVNGFSNIPGTNVWENDVHLDCISNLQVEIFNSVTKEKTLLPATVEMLLKDYFPEDNKKNTLP